MNWITIVPALACFDDGVLGRSLNRIAEKRVAPVHAAQQFASVILLALLALLSIGPVANMLSPRQIMNTSFSRPHLVNTYGAFGTIGRERFELVFEGTDVESPGDGSTWKPYEFPCKPTDINRQPCFITPYHYRLDWLLWFAAMGGPQQYPWSVHLILKLLENDPAVMHLLARNPFPDEPPRAVRVDLYRYQLVPPGEKGWWRRERLGPWLPPLTLKDPRLREFLKANGFVH